MTTLGGGMLAMGIAGVCCATVATLLLPETAGRDLATIGEEITTPIEVRDPS